jgi:hypothetical protein
VSRLDEVVDEVSTVARLMLGALLLVLLFAALALVGGCDPSFPERAGQDEATRITWRATFGSTADPPGIDWREVDCTSTLGQLGITDRWTGGCVGGLFYQDPDVVEVPWLGSFHESAFAHELMHALQALRGVRDPDHLVREDWAKVAAANEALKAVGL